MAAYAEQQEQEVQALQAIYGADFAFAKSKNSWAGHEFVVRIRPLDEALHDVVRVSVHFKLGAAYPRVPPTLALEKPIAGLTADVLTLIETKLKEAARSKEMLGNEMIFDLCSLAAQLITDKHSVVTGQTSLREEAEKREEQDRRELEARRQAQLDLERAEREKERNRLNEMLKEDQQRRVQRVEHEPSKEVPVEGSATNGRSRFDIPLIYLERPFPLSGGQLAAAATEGTVLSESPLLSVFSGDALSEDMVIRQPISLHVVEFPRAYLTSASTKRKINIILEELQRVATLHHPNLQRVHAFQLSSAQHDTRLEIVTEPHCQTSLEMLLYAAGPLPEERALAYMRQLAGATAALHDVGLTHSNALPELVQLCGPKASLIKLSGAPWMQRLVDLNRSEPFAPDSRIERVPEGWRAPETVEQIMTYSRPRDMWDLGRLLLLMLLGRDSMERFESCYAAIQSEEFSDLSDAVADILEGLLDPNPRKRVTVARLLTMLEKSDRKVGPVSPSVKTVRLDSLPTPGGAASSNAPIVDSRAFAPVDGRASYFWQPRQQASAQVSRYRTDFEEVEFLGKGGFGQVVKARNRLDGAFYAIKRIRLPRSAEAEQKLLREVTIWSRMSHPHIVRYNTSWVEEEKDAGFEVQEAAHSLSVSIERSNQASSSSLHSDAVNTDEDFDLGLDDLDLDDIDFLSVSKSASYPSIRFANDGDPSNAPSPDDSDGSNPSGRAGLDVARIASPLPVSMKRTLYIQMEYCGGGVHGQTLREAIDAGLPESETWRLLRQMLSAMQHFTSIAIIHRDLKPQNIFLDPHGDVRIGDFGLAVEQAASADLQPASMTVDETKDLTSDVGTGLYVAPETASRGAGFKANGLHQPYTNKIDMYSLGIILFEMWHPMRTGMERVQLLRDLRSPQIRLPSSWKGNERQTQILQWLLAHDPSKRASPADLLRSELLPSIGRNEAVENVVQLLATPRSPHRAPIISALLKQTPDERIIRDLTYDPLTGADDTNAELDAYMGVVTDRLREIFEKRGAISLPGDAIMPLSDIYENAGRKPFKVIDTDGNVLMLPYDLTAPLARKVAREPNLGRLKRWTVGQVFRPRPAGGPPEAITAAAFDIVSSYNTLAAEAETLQMLDEIASSFPLDADYLFVVNHASLFEFALEQIPSTARASVVKILETFSKRGAVSWTKIANELFKQPGLTKRAVDSLIPFHFFEDAEIAIQRLERLSSGSKFLQTALADLRTLLSYCNCFAMTRAIKIWPLFLANRTHLDRGGIGFQLSQAHKLGDVLAVGGRYDRLLANYAPPTLTSPLPHMTGTFIAVAKLAEAARQASLAANQRAQPDYARLTPRRCDVYVISYAGGLLEARIQVVAQLWASGISADLVYDERDWSAQSPEQAAATWRKEGILFVVNVKQHSVSGDQIVRVRNVLRGGEEDVSRLELPDYLLERIAELSSAARTSDHAGAHMQSPSRRQHDVLRPSSQNVHFILSDEPGARKQRARNRQLVTEKAIQHLNARLDNVDPTPVFAVDVDGEAFRVMCDSATWITKDESFRALVAAAPAGRKSHLSDVRSALQAHKVANPKCSWVWLFSMRESLSGLLSMS